jgi:hypothetical protein
MLHTHLGIRGQSLGWSISTDYANAQLVSTAEKVDLQLDPAKKEG